MKRKISIVMTLVLMLSAIFSINVSAASYPSNISSSNYIEFRAQQNINVYKDSKFKDRGTYSPSKKYDAYIEKGDDCYIYEIASSYIIINYPTSSGRRTGYIKRADMFDTTSPVKYIPSAKAKVSVYKSTSGSYIAKGDKVWHVDPKKGYSGYKAVIYEAKSGKRAYKMGYITLDDLNKIKKTTNSNTSNSSSSSAVSTKTSSGYATYKGVDYTSILTKAKNNGEISTTEYNNRIKLLNKAQNMVTVIWTAPKSFHTWKASGGTYNSNKKMLYEGNTSNYTKFVKGCKYTGIPYAANASYNQLDDTKWLSLINQSSPKLEGSVNYLNITRTNCTFQGIDCSGFVYKAYSALGNYKVGYLSTKSLLNSSYWKQTKASSALPGDILLKNGHVMIFVGKTSGGKIAVMESVADGANGTSGCRYYEFSSVSGYNYYRYKNIGK